MVEVEPSLGFDDFSPLIDSNGSDGRKINPGHTIDPGIKDQNPKSNQHGSDDGVNKLEIIPHVKIVEGNVSNGDDGSSEN